MEGIYYGYVLQAQRKILESQKKKDLNGLETIVENSINERSGLFRDDKQKTPSKLQSYSIGSYSMFLNPTFMNP